MMQINVIPAKAGIHVNKILTDYLWLVVDSVLQRNDLSISQKNHTISSHVLNKV
jgi:hypothetical protein